MSKVTKRKITVESASNKLSNSNTISNISSHKDSQRRQSVFERLGTKTGASISLNIGPQPSSGESFCRHWSQNGTCPYGKACVFVNTHILISPSKRIPKKELDPKQLLARSLEEGLKLEGLKRLNSTVVKRGSPDLNWESWDQTDLEYEDEKVLEKRRQLLQRELELQMKREETEEHHSKRKHSNTKQRKGLSSSSSTSVSSTSSESSTSSDDSSSDSSSTSGVAGNSKRRRSKIKKSKRGSTSSVSDSERKKVRGSNKSMHKDRSPSNISRKSTSSRDKRAFTPPKKTAPNAKIAARKKSPSPSHRRHNTPTASSKTTKPSTSKSSQGGSRHNQSPRPSKRSTSVERKDKHKRSLSPRPRGKTGVKERSPRRQDPRPRRKDSPDPRPRNTSRSRLPDSRVEDRKKDDDRSRNKDDRRQDRKTTSERDKRDHDDVRAREKAREAAREKEREEALERCRERQREREQLAKEKERNRDRPRDDRDKDNTKQRDYDKSIPQLMTVSIHNQPDRKLTDRDRDRSNKDRKDREKDRDKDKDRDRDRIYDRNIDKTDRNRLLEKDRVTEKLPDRDRGNDKDRPRERENLNDRNREKGDRDRSFERDRSFNRNVGEAADRTFERDKERTSKVLDRGRDRDFERDKDRGFERITDNRRSFDKVGERDRTSLEKDRGVVRDRGIDRVLELRERNKSLERGRASDGERSVDRNRDRFEREGRFDRRALAADEKGYESPYDSRRDRPRYGADGSERVGGMFKDHSPSREDARGIRHAQGFNDDRRSRGGRDVRGGWEQRGGYEETGSSKTRDWEYPDSRREWDTRNRHGEWEGAVEGEEWGRYGGDWGGEWRDDWQHRPPRHPPRDDQTIVSSNHIVVRDANNEDPSGRRGQVLDSIEKDPMNIGDFKKDCLDSGNVPLDSGSHKRQREASDMPVEAKKPRLEEPPPSTILEEALSDISDDPDEILNREDIDITPQDSAMMEEDVRLSAASVQPSNQELDQRLLEDRPSEEENIDNLDFEEISDEELEEEARANKGLGDALGVDWASLVTESRPKPAEAVAPGAARRRWQPDNILARIGVSLQYAGSQLYEQIQQQLTDKKGEEGDKEKQSLLHPVATLHVALRDRQARRRCLFSGTDKFKRALSARADIAIRRQLCNLPVASLEMQQSSGFCQWVV